MEVLTVSGKEKEVSRSRGTEDTREKNSFMNLLSSITLLDIGDHGGQQNSSVGYQ